TRFGNRLGYTWFPGEESGIFKHGFSSGGTIHWSNARNALESLGWRLEYSLQTRDNWFVGARVRPAIEQIDEEFELSDDVIIPPGDYNFWSGELDIGTPFTEPLWAIATFGWGKFYDGDQFSVFLNPTFNVSPSLELTGTYQYNRIRFDSRGDLFNVHLGRLNVLAMFSTKLSISALLQYNSLDKVYSGNIRLRYNPREGNDLYLVFNSNINTDRHRELPILPKSNERALLVKYAYTFRM
ncbi:MAG: hypothetical protein R3330_13495, partial [Saprospiraceae bacterium]|nr:hypothetical protein [Saprospiraceae bacterium]